MVNNTAERLWFGVIGLPYGVLGGFFAPWSSVPGHTAGMWIVRHLGAGAVTFAVMALVAPHLFGYNGVPEDKMFWTGLAAIAVGAAGAWMNAYVAFWLFGVPIGGL